MNYFQLAHVVAVRRSYRTFPGDTNAHAYIAAVGQIAFDDDVTVEHTGCLATYHMTDTIRNKFGIC